MKIARIFAAVLMMVFLAACDGPEQREAAHFERGKEFFEAGNFVKARLEFKNVLQINPRSVEGRYYIGLVEESEGNPQQAFANFRKAVEQQPDHIPSLVKLGQYLLLGGHLDESLKKADEVLALNPLNADGHALRAAIHLRRGNLVKAREEVALALDADAKNISAISALVGIERKQGQPALALKTLDGAIAQHPDNKGLRLLKVRLLIEQKLLDEAGEVFRELIVLDPDNLGFKTSLAKILIRQKRPDDAEALLRETIEKSPDDPAPKLLLVDFLLNQRGAEEAEKALLAYLKESPDNHTFRFTLAEIYLKAKDRAKAVAVFREVAALDEKGARGLAARTALAQIHLAQGEKLEADTLIAEILEIDPQNGEALFLRAQNLLQQGEVDRAITDLRTLLRNRPGFSNGRRLLARAHLGNGERGLAIEAFRTLLEFEPQNLGVRAELAQQLSLQGETEPALKILDEVLQQTPGHLLSLQTRAEIYRRRGDWAGLAETATNIIDRTAEKPLGHYMRGQAYRAEKRFDEAVIDFRQALELKPDSMEPLVGLVQIYLEQKKGAEAEDLVEARLAAKPENWALHNLMGELHRSRAKPDLAAASFRTAIAQCKACTIPYLNLGRGLVRSGETAAAIKVYRDGLAAKPGAVNLSFALAETLQIQKDYDGAIGIYEGMLARDPRLLAASNNLAALIADFQYKDAAKLKRAFELAKRFENMKNPLFVDTLGWVYYRQGEIDQALNLLEQATAKAPKLAQLQYHLGMVYLAAGEPEKARRALTKAVAGEVDYPGVQVARATLEKL